jgi:hypothetical protein
LHRCSSPKEPEKSIMPPNRMARILVVGNRRIRARFGAGRHKIGDRQPRLAAAIVFFRHLANGAQVSPRF